MALTNTVRVSEVLGERKFVVANVTGDSSYATGGEAFVPADIGLEYIDSVWGGGSGYSVTYDRTNGKLLFFAGASQVSNTTDLSAVSVVVHAVGQ
jgi:hypothetical protein